LQKQTKQKSILISFILSINKQSWRALGEDICQQTPKERKERKERKKEKKQQEVDTRRIRAHRETETQRNAYIPGGNVIDFAPDDQPTILWRVMLLHVFQAIRLQHQRLAVTSDNRSARSRGGGVGSSSSDAISICT